MMPLVRSMFGASAKVVLFPQIVWTAPQNCQTAQTGEVLALLPNFSGLVFFFFLIKNLSFKEEKMLAQGHTASPGEACKSSDPVFVVRRLALMAAG